LIRKVWTSRSLSFQEDLTAQEIGVLIDRHADLKTKLMAETAVALDSCGNDLTDMIYERLIFCTSIARFGHPEIRVRLDMHDRLRQLDATTLSQNAADINMLDIDMIDGHHPGKLRTARTATAPDRAAA